MEWKMPDLGEGVQEGEIVKWAVKEGDKISHDQHLLEIMTDKATMEIPSPADGTLEKILIKEGEIAKVGQVMAVIAAEGTKDHGPWTMDQKKEETREQKTEDRKRRTEKKYTTREKTREKKETESALVLENTPNPAVAGRAARSAL